jgi:DNA invertase Pin-like site-specific DNA recombinase
MNKKWTSEEGKILKNNFDESSENIKIMLKGIGSQKTIDQINSKKSQERKKTGNLKKRHKKGFLNEKVDFILEKLGEGVDFGGIAKMLDVKSPQLLRFLRKDPQTKEKIEKYTKQTYYSVQELNIVAAESAKSNPIIQKILLGFGFERSVYQVSQMKIKIAVEQYSAKNITLKTLKGNEDNMLVMLKDGWSVKRISYELGVDKTTLRKYLKETMKLDLSIYGGVKEFHIAKKAKKQKTEQDALLPPKIYAYIRVSSEGQTIENQRYELIPFAKLKGLVIEEWYEEIISGAKDIAKRKLSKLLQVIKKGDILFVAELSRLSRTLIGIIGTLGEFTKKGVMLYSKKENFELNNSIVSTISAQIFGMFAQIERDLTIQRTKEGLDRRQSMGMKLGRTPNMIKSNIVSSDCVQHDQTIQDMISKNVSYSDISKVIGVNRSSIITYLKNKEKGVIMVTRAERYALITKQRQEYGFSILSTYLPNFTFGDFAYLLANKNKFIEFKNIGFSYSDLVQILGVDDENLKRIMM